MGKLVEDATARAMEALIVRDAPLAERVISGDRQVDLKEIEVEEECLKVLALHQPVALDLRFIVAVLKVNNDLERMGDLALNIAERAVALSRMPPVDPPADLRAMMEKVNPTCTAGCTRACRSAWRRTRSASRSTSSISPCRATWSGSRIRPRT
jgi:phosphate transport system protein